MSLTRRTLLHLGAGAAVASQLPIVLTGCGRKPTPDDYSSYDVDFIGLEGRLKRRYDATANNGIDVWLRLSQGYNAPEGTISEHRKTTDEQRFREFVDEGGNIYLNAPEFIALAQRAMRSERPTMLITALEGLAAAYEKGVRAEDIDFLEEELGFTYLKEIEAGLDGAREFLIMGMLKERFDDPEFMKLARVTLPGSRKDEGYFLSLIRSYDIGEVEAADLELLARSGLHGRGIGFNVDTLCDRAKRGNYNFGHKELEESLQKRYDSMNQGEIKVVLKGASGLQTFFDSGFDEYLTEAGFVDLVDTVCETRFVDLNFLDFLVNAYLSGYKLEDDEFVRDAREAYGLFVNPPPPSPEEAEHRSYEKSKLEKLAEKFAPVEEKTYTRSLQRSARKIDKRIEDAQELQRQVETGEKDFPNKRVNGILLPDTFSSSIIGQYATDPFFNWFNAFNNANAFAEAGRQYEQNFLPAKDEVNIVYVAAGYHVAPLEVALQLFEQGAVNRANYVYTDVDEQSMNDYVTVLSLLKEQGLFKEVTVEDSNVDVGEEKRIRVTYETKSGEEKEINIRYALCGTGLRTITSDYVKDADLLIDHDSGFVGLAGDPMTRRAEFMLEYWKAQNPDMVFLVEGGKPLSNLDADTIANTDHYYGCRGDNALHPKQADHLRLDQPEELDGFVLVKPDSNYLEMSKREMLNTIRTKRE